jgi:hypothetical protein
MILIKYDWISPDGLDVTEVPAIVGGIWHYEQYSGGMSVQSDQVYSSGQNRISNEIISSSLDCYAQIKLPLGDLTGLNIILWLNGYGEERNALVITYNQLTLINNDPVAVSMSSGDICKISRKNNIVQASLNGLVIGSSAATKDGYSFFLESTDCLVGDYEAGTNESAPIITGKSSSSINMLFDQYKKRRHKEQ